MRVQQIADALPRQVFLSGSGVYPEISGIRIKWVAVRGNILDWAVYYDRVDVDEDIIARKGDKMYDQDLVARVTGATAACMKYYRR